MPEGEEKKQSAFVEEEEKKQSAFVIEKIKERPINRKKLLRRTMVTASMAVIFGLIACLTFLILEPVFSKFLYPPEEPEVVTFPEDVREMGPEEMIGLETAAGEALEEKHIQEILSGVVLSKDNYRQIYADMASYSLDLSKSMVTVTGVSSTTDWLNTVTENKGQAAGVILANNGRELLILTTESTVRNTEKLQVTFYNKGQYEAKLKQAHHITGLAVLTVNLGELPDSLKENLTVAKLGSSNVKSMSGLPVVALGTPMGTKNSVAYGMISSAGGLINLEDGNYHQLITDIYGSQGATGVLFNLQGQVVGIVSPAAANSELKNLISAYGITELKKLIEKMSNGVYPAYLGIVGVDVSEEAHAEQNVPYGAYVKDVKMDSPAMLAGIQQGDVITSMGISNILTCSDYTLNLMARSPGEEIVLNVMRQSQGEYREMEFRITLGAAE